MIYTLTAIFFFFLSLFVWNFRIIDYGGIFKSKSIRKKKILKVSLLISCFWLILHDGLRWEIGTDWINYYNLFQTGTDHHIKDFGYLLLNDLVRYVSERYTILILVIALFTYFVLYKFFIRRSLNPIMSICIYYCSMIGMMGCNRQIIAMLICMISLIFVEKKQKVPFIVLVLLAFLFHKTAICFLPVYYIYELKYKNSFAYLAIWGAFLIGLTRIINHLPFVEYLALLDSLSSGTDFSLYLDNVWGNVSLSGSFKRLLFASLAIHVRNRINSKYYSSMLTLYIVGCCIYLMFNGSVLQLMAGRGALYYSIFESIVIPYVIYTFPIKGIDKRVVWSIFFAMYFYLMWRDMNGYIVEVGYDIYNPYKCVLFI